MAIQHDVEPEVDGDHESPLVLLLSLAIEKGEISVSDPRKDCSPLEEQKSGGHDWGVLRGFLDYLRQFEFQTLQTPRNPKSSYWPGLPFCIMALVPFEDSHQSKHRISVSATLDRLDYDLTVQLSTCIYVKREKRLQNFEALCNKTGKKQIDSARKYSNEILEWRKTVRYRDLLQPCEVEVGNLQYVEVKSSHPDAEVIYRNHIDSHNGIMICDENYKAKDRNG